MFTIYLYNYFSDSRSSGIICNNASVSESVLCHYVVYAGTKAFINSLKTNNFASNGKLHRCKHFTVTKHYRLCSDHFRAGDYKNEGLFTGQSINLM